MDDRYKNIGTVPTRTVEECSELIKAICKADRFGWENYIPGTNQRNLERVKDELHDVMYRCKELEDHIGMMEEMIWKLEKHE